MLTNDHYMILKYAYLSKDIFLVNRHLKKMISFDIPDLGNFVIDGCPSRNPCLIVKDKVVGLFQYNVAWTSLAVIGNFKFEFDRFIYMYIDCGVS